jgi:hypothetical protein
MNTSIGKLILESIRQQADISGAVMNLKDLISFTINNWLVLEINIFSV